MSIVEVNYVAYYHRDKRTLSLSLHIYTNKAIVVSFIKPIPNDAFKAHMLGLKISKIQSFGICCYVMDMFFHL